MHLAKIDGQWKVVNVLWDAAPGETYEPAKLRA